MIKNENQPNAQQRQNRSTKCHIFTQWHTKWQLKHNKMIAALNSMNDSQKHSIEQNKPVHTHWFLLHKVCINYKLLYQQTRGDGSWEETTWRWGWGSEGWQGKGMRETSKEIKCSVSSFGNSSLRSTGKINKMCLKCMYFTLHIIYRKNYKEK